MPNVKTSDALRNTIAMIKPGTSVDLDIMHRDGKTASMKAKLGELPDEAQASAQPRPQQQGRQVKPKVKKLPGGGTQWTWEYP